MVRSMNGIVVTSFSVPLIISNHEHHHLRGAVCVVMMMHDIMSLWIVRLHPSLCHQQLSFPCHSSSILFQNLLFSSPQISSITSPLTVPIPLSYQHHSLILSFPPSHYLSSTSSLFTLFIPIPLSFLNNTVALYTHRCRRPRLRPLHYHACFQETQQIKSCSCSTPPSFHCPFFVF
jgi:hypothetical protein